LSGKGWMRCAGGVLSRAMKHLLPAGLFLILLATLLLSGCSSYDASEGSGFSQRDLELQRKLSERQLGR